MSYIVKLTTSFKKAYKKLTRNTVRLKVMSMPLRPSSVKTHIRVPTSGAASARCVWP